MTNRVGTYWILIRDHVQGGKRGDLFKCVLDDNSTNPFFINVSRGNYNKRDCITIHGNLEFFGTKLENGKWDFVVKKKIYN